MWNPLLEEKLSLNFCWYDISQYIITQEVMKITNNFIGLVMSKLNTTRFETTQNAKLNDVQSNASILSKDRVMALKG